jgi:hypothetical protein
VTDQPPSQQQPAEESEEDKPAALVSDGSPTEVGSPEPAGAAEPVAPEPGPAEPEPAGAEPEPEPAGGEPAGAEPEPAGAPEPPAAIPPPPPVTELPAVDSGSSGPGGLAAAFGPDRPERAIGAAFAGGLVLALILKRLAR